MEMCHFYDFTSKAKFGSAYVPLPHSTSLSCHKRHSPSFSIVQMPFESAMSSKKTALQEIKQEWVVLTLKQKMKISTTLESENHMKSLYHATGIYMQAAHHIPYTSWVTESLL